MTAGSEVTVQESSSAIRFLSNSINVVIEIQFGVNGDTEVLVAVNQFKRLAKNGVSCFNWLEGYSSVAGLFKGNPSNIYAAFYMISTDSVLARFLCISRTFVSIQRSQPCMGV